MMEEEKQQCPDCNGEIFDTLVQYGSYYLQCARCHSPAAVTSFFGIKDQLKGTYEIIEVDDNMNPLRTIATGQIQDYIDIVRTEARKGKKIWLRGIQY
jgi:hypothetical protein